MSEDQRKDTELLQDGRFKMAANAETLIIDFWKKSQEGLKFEMVVLISNGNYSKNHVSLRNEVLRCGFRLFLDKIGHCNFWDV